MRRLPALFQFRHIFSIHLKPQAGSLPRPSMQCLDSHLSAPGSLQLSSASTSWSPGRSSSPARAAGVLGRTYQASEASPSTASTASCQRHIRNKTSDHRLGMLHLPQAISVLKAVAASSETAKPASVSCGGSSQRILAHMTPPSE